jgi:heptosyltransferase II
MTTMVFAPNWLGDAVMMLPALADVRRCAGEGHLVVAARRSVAPLFTFVPGVDRVLELGPGGSLARAARVVREDARAVRAVDPAIALLFPNSIHSAVTARLAGVPERWGYRRDGRGVLLTRAIPSPRGRVHQVDAYRRLVEALGMPNGPREPQLDLGPAMVDGARSLLMASGWDPARRLVGFAPGAAYGRAKQWPPDRVAAVMARVAQERDAVCVLVGAAADAGTIGEVSAHLDRIIGPATGRLINLAGATTLALLAGVLSLADVFVSNDSGAMHLAAAVGTPVVAMFGPTNEFATAPVPRPDHTASILTGSAWCRPCGFRECPLRQGCMTSISVDRVYQAVSDQL